MQLRIIGITGLTVLFFVSLAFAPPIPPLASRVERWNDMPMGQVNTGWFGGGADMDPCPQSPWAPACELPAGSGQQYLYQAGIWVGALIVEDGFETPRVSTCMDGWLPSINELWPNTGYTERSALDTTNCLGAGIASEAAIADHEYECVLADTMTSPFWVEDDPIDGPHRPLGLQITHTTYAALASGCSHITWIRYHVENIGQNYLKNLYLGLYVDGNARSSNPGNQGDDDVVGYDPVSNAAYFADNDGRDIGDGSGSDFVTPHVLGCLFLDNDLSQFTSCNWWLSHDDEALDYGPAWAAYGDQDSLGMGWTSHFGTPLGDQHKYQLLSNQEIDFDQVQLAEPLAAIPPQHWRHPVTGDIIDQPWSTHGATADARDIANGYDVRNLVLARGPYGIYDYTEASGRRVYRLNPGESCDVWMAWVGGLNLHNASQPQPTDTVINPALFDFTDLRAQATTARQQGCVEWNPLGVTNPPAMKPAAFALTAIYPNPFNATARVSLLLPQATRLSVRVYDLLGREAQLLADGAFTAGRHEILWSAHDLPAGVYFLDARTAKGQRAVQKAMLLK